MRFEDLPSADRRAIRAGLARPVPPGPKDGPGVPRSRPSRAPGSSSHLCARCGETFGRYPLAERHADEEHKGATRIECAL